MLWDLTENKPEYTYTTSEVVTVLLRASKTLGSFTSKSLSNMRILTVAVKRIYLPNNFELEKFANVISVTVSAVQNMNL